MSQLDVRPDIVFTHGYRGEYGHPHHIALHHIAHTCFDNVWDFLHFPDRADEPQLVRGRVCEIPTDARKLRLLEEAYPEMVATLRAADPGLWRAQMTGLSEFFTS